MDISVLSTLKQVICARFKSAMVLRYIDISRIRFISMREGSDSPQFPGYFK